MITTFRGSGGNRVLSSQRSTTDTLTAATINTTETAFGTSYLFAAATNPITAGRLIRITLSIEALATAAVPTSILRLRLQKSGPTNVNLYVSTALAFTAGTLSYGGIWLLQGTAAPGAAVSVETGSMFGNVQGPFGRNTLGAAATVDTASDQTLQFTLQYSTNAASNSTTIRQLLIEELT